jgi:hypothetical protein
VVDEHDGDGVAALQFAQEGEQRGDVTADILIDAMQPHERIEDHRGFSWATVSSSRARSASRRGAGWRR